MPSRLLIYYNERVMEHSVASDSGAQIRDGTRAWPTGRPPDTEWPYAIAKFKTEPAAACYQDAPKDRAVSYRRVTQSLGQLKGCLASGWPFAFGFTVYERFESPAVAKSGHGAPPASGEAVVVGDAVVGVGDDDARSGSSCGIRGARAGG